MNIVRMSQIGLAVTLLTACGAQQVVKAQVTGTVVQVAPAQNTTAAPAPVPTTVPAPTPAPIPTPTLPPPASVAPAVAPKIAPVVASIKADCGLPNFEKEMLALVNAARSKPRQCGAAFMPAVGPVLWDMRLQNTAALHSTDMARRDFFGHDNPDGKGFAQRIQANGYDWKTAGENIASGQDTVAQAMRDWLISPPHCVQIMGASYAHVAGACILDRKSIYATFWTMSLGSE
jgi:uncharacterized protein YkwD